jgi:metal-responsive CopG/Arc/MetJ family transcriptional regulator
MKRRTCIALSVRVDSSLAPALDAIVRRKNETLRFELALSRSDIIRLALISYIEACEKEGSP